MTAKKTAGSLGEQQAGLGGDREASALLHYRAPGGKRQTDQGARSFAVGVRLNAQERAGLLALANEQKIPIAWALRRLIRQAIQKRRQDGRR